MRQIIVLAMLVMTAAIGCGPGFASATPTPSAMPMATPSAEFLAYEEIIANRGITKGDTPDLYAQAVRQYDEYAARREAAIPSRPQEARNRPPGWPWSGRIAVAAIIGVFIWRWIKRRDAERLDKMLRDATHDG